MAIAIVYKNVIGLNVITPPNVYNIF